MHLSSTGSTTGFARSWPSTARLSTRSRGVRTPRPMRAPGASRRRGWRWAPRAAGPRPRPGMALRAAARLGFDPSEAVVVGDHLADLGMGRAIGATTILVRTGHGADSEPAAGDLADHVADDLGGAVTIIARLVRPDPWPDSQSDSRPDSRRGS